MIRHMIRHISYFSENIEQFSPFVVQDHSLDDLFLFAASVLCICAAESTLLLDSVCSLSL